MLLSGILVCGCGQLFTVGVRRLHWNGLNVRQEGSRSNPQSITSFSQLYYTPDPDTPAVSIRMPDGKFIAARELNRTAVSPYLASGTAHEFQDGISLDYSRGNVTVYLDDDGRMKRIIVDIHRVYARDDIRGRPPALSKLNSDKVLEFPLKEKDLRDLLGEPTKDETYNFAT